ncbi:MAG: hypothetical protein OEL76_10355 [Siculibacillus sp.]|nr:hypothetical protein [Siculibacillus sp.]
MVALRSLLTALLRRTHGSALVRSVARRVPRLRFLTGGVHRSKVWGVARGGPVVLGFGFPPEAEVDVDRALPEMAKHFVARKARAKIVRDEFRRCGSEAVLQWGGFVPRSLQGLIRDVGTLPTISCWSGPVPLRVGGNEYRTIAVDWSGLYINPRRSNDLELILNHFDFRARPDLVALAGRLRRAAFPPPTGTEVTVILQDRSDRPMAYAPPDRPSPAELVAIARREHPEARANVAIMARADRVASIAAGLPDDVAIVPSEAVGDALARSAHVYTVNSPIAVDAVLRGAAVTVFGQPFFAGYGLTDDRGRIVRRTRQLDADELFAGLFGLHCRLIGPDGRLVGLTTIDDALRGASAA